MLQTLFPARPRILPGQRWLGIGLRTAHLVGIAGIGGGFLLGVEPESWLAYWYLTLISGVGLVALYIASSAVWLCQMKGLAILTKLLLLVVGVVVPEWGAGIFVLVIIISGVIAHAPGRVRGWRWLRWPAPDPDIPNEPASTNEQRGAMNQPPFTAEGKRSDNRL